MALRPTAPPRKRSSSIWSRGKVIALARESCCICGGYGLLSLWEGRRERVCGCVLRAIFRAGLKRYHYCAICPRASHSHGLNYGFKAAEYRADFWLLARRTLSGSDWNVFQRHFLEDQTWVECAPALRLDRGTFYHRAYHIERDLGRAMTELEPYPLWPLGRYFAGEVSNRAFVPTRRPGWHWAEEHRAKHRPMFRISDEEAATL